MSPVLETRGLTAHYGDFQALYGIDLAADAGDTVAIIGANGAGKTTLLRSICGLLPSPPDSIRFKGAPIGHLPANATVRLGIAMVPEGRRLFPSLSVEENLRLGGYAKRPGKWTLDRVYALFPVLRQRRDTPATLLSGGQQQMVAIGRALMSNPELLLCDEVSLGLAPIIIREIYDSLPSIVAEGTTLIIVEQDINQALAVATRVYCLLEGRVSLAGTPDDLTRDRIKVAYFGL